MDLKNTLDSAVEPRNLLVRLFEYIEEQTKNIDPRGFNLSKTSGFRCKPQDIVSLPGIELDIKPEGDHVWLRINRLESGKPPKIGPEFSAFITSNPNPFGPLPRLNESSILHKISELKKDADEVDILKRESEFRANVQHAFQEYLDIWKGWAEGEKPRQRTINLYGELFALKHQIEAEETAHPVELVWGIGTALWQLTYENTIFDFQYPLLTQAIEISLDENSMALEIRPRITDTRVELDAFVTCSIVGAADVEKAVKEHIAKHSDSPVTPFDSSSYSDVLKLIATNLDSKGSYQEINEEEIPLLEAEEHLIVTDSWIIFSRPRTNNYLVEDLHRLIAKLNQGCVIPSGPLAFVSAPSDIPIEFEPVNFRGLSSRGDGTVGEPKELYLPVPYSAEQVTIIQRLEKAAGVTVQGPPGTGKTHAIANIICHYLATGKRILVTSRGEPALSVLQAKIPEEIRSLSVALLTNDREGIRQFQASIEAIQHRVSQLSPENTREEIKTLKQAIDRAHGELAKIDNRIDEIALSQLSEIQIDGISMRAQKMAELVMSGQSQYEWFDDELSLSSKHSPPLTESQAGQLREARRYLGSDLVYVDSKIPAADQLPAVDEIMELHNILCKIDHLNGQEKTGTLLPLKPITSDILEKARTLLEHIENAKLIVKSLEFTAEPWPFQLRANCREDAYKSEREALEALFEEIDLIVVARAEFLKRPVEMPQLALNSVKTREAIDRAAQTGKPFGILSLRIGNTKEHINSIKIAGQLPNGIDDWAHIKQYINLHEKVISFLVRWNQFADLLAIPRLQGDINSLRLIEQMALAARKAHNLGVEIDKKLLFLAEEVFETPPVKNIFGGSQELEEVRSHLLRHLTRADLSTATALLSVLQERVNGCSGPVSEYFRNFVEQQLGNNAFESNWIANKYLELLNEIRRIGNLSQHISTLQDLSRQIERNGAS